MNEREFFESKFKSFSHTFNESLCRIPNTDQYYSDIAQAAWEAWQASANREGYKLVPVEPTDEMLKKVETEKECFFQVSSDYCDLNIPAYIAADIYRAMIGATNDH